MTLLVAALRTLFVFIVTGGLIVFVSKLHVLGYKIVLKLYGLKGDASIQTNKRVAFVLHEVSSFRIEANKGRKFMLRFYRSIALSGILIDLSVIVLGIALFQKDLPNIVDFLFLKFPVISVGLVSFFKNANPAIPGSEGGLLKSTLGASSDAGNVHDHYSQDFSAISKQELEELEAKKREYIDKYCIDIGEDKIDNPFINEMRHTFGYLYKNNELRTHDTGHRVGTNIDEDSKAITIDPLYLDDKNTRALIHVLSHVAKRYGYTINIPRSIATNIADDRLQKMLLGLGYEELDEKYKKILV